MHAQDWPVAPALARRLIALQMPELAHLPLRRVGQSGTDNVLYRLGTALVARFPRRPEAARQIALQAQLLPDLSRHLTLAAPLTRHLGCPGEGYPYPWSVLDWLPGRPATEGLDQPRAARDLARFLQALQSITLGPGVPRNSDDLFQRFQQLDAQISLFGDQADPVVLRRAAERLAPPPPRNDQVWQHGDLHGLNLLVQGHRLTGVLDWGCMGVGDPGVDLMVAWTLFDAPARQSFHDLMRPHPTDWARGRALAFAKAIAAIPYYRLSNPIFAAMMHRTLHRVLEEL